MSQYFYMHPETPQSRLVKQAVAIVREGGVVAYPTDTCYALGCHIGDKSALERIVRLRQLDDRHNFTLICRDLSEIATYAKVDNTEYRLLRNHTPGPYTFILKATGEVPRRILHPKRKTIGIRVPDSAICQALLAELGEPMLTTTLQLPGEEYPMNDPEVIRDRIGKLLDLVIDGGHGSLEPTTVVDLSEGEVQLVRVGAGDPAPFQ